MIKKIEAIPVPQICTEGRGQFGWWLWSRRIRKHSTCWWSPSIREHTPKLIFKSRQEIRMPLVLRDFENFRFGKGENIYSIGREVKRPEYDTCGKCNLSNGAHTQPTTNKQAPFLCLLSIACTRSTSRGAKVISSRHKRLSRHLYDSLHWKRASLVQEKLARNFS